MKESQSVIIHCLFVIVLGSVKMLYRDCIWEAPAIDTLYIANAINFLWENSKKKYHKKSCATASLYIGGV